MLMNQCESKKDFHPDIFIKRFVIIQVVMRDVAEQGAGIIKTGVSMLVQCMNLFPWTHVCILYPASASAAFRLTASGVVWVAGITLLPIIFSTVLISPYIPVLVKSLYNNVAPLFSRSARHSTYQFHLLRWFSPKKLCAYPRCGCTVFPLHIG